MSRAKAVLTHGTIAGILGAIAVAAWFLALDIAAGHPFRTPAALGLALLFGERTAPQVIDTSFTVVATYTVVHVVAFVIAGWVFAFIADQLERRPSFVLLAVLTVIVLEAVAAFNLAEGAQWSGLSLWSILIANILAVAVMTGYLWRVHMRLGEKIAKTTRAHPSQVRV